ncbi:cytochrome P450, partial [Amycolatopsis sp. K13G38]|nr:cytochrome P450 [Amycolatopsis acididurans]
MVHIIERTTQAARQRLSSVLVAPAPQAVDEAWRRFSRRWPTTDLATPPEGSGLRPVRGDYGPPVVGHLLDYIRFGT